MTVPPKNLMDWPKAELVKELQRQRAINMEHASRSHDPARSGGGMVDVAGDPHARGGVVLDTRGAVLMDGIDVCLVDTKRGETPAMMMVLEGRVNLEDKRTSQAYMFSADGAAGIVTEIFGVVVRSANEFTHEFHVSMNSRT
jgi:hypothetical protein